jgi:hypothetical protein
MAKDLGNLPKGGKLRAIIFKFPAFNRERIRENVSLWQSLPRRKPTTDADCKNLGTSRLPRRNRELTGKSRAASCESCTKNTTRWVSTSRGFKYPETEILFGPTHEAMHLCWLEVNQTQKPFQPSFSHPPACNIRGVRMPESWIAA